MHQIARLQTKTAALLIALSCCMTAASTATAKPSRVSSLQYVTIPVLYVTDRAPTKDGYGPQRKSETVSTIDEMNFGWLDYSLPTARELTDQETRLGWSESKKRPRHELTTKPLDMRQYSQFGQVVLDTAKKTDSDEIFVVVHGFNTPFAHAAREAAMLSHAVRRPVILYSWPSKGKLAQYSVDLGNNEWSQEHFDSLMEELNQIKDTSGIKFTLVAHSMGNKLAVRATPVMRGKHLFKQIFLVDPDFDAETFVHYLVRYARNTENQIEPTADSDDKAPAQTKVRILFSHRDRALPLSEFLFGGYTRLGQAADSLLSSLVTPHSLPSITGLGKESSERRPENQMDNNPDWLVKFEWIDFTALDHGLIGHTIPYKLVASLWSTDTPGDGLKLVSGDNGEPNRMSRIFMRVFKESEHISSKINSSKKVVRTKEDLSTD